MKDFMTAVHLEWNLILNSFCRLHRMDTVCFFVTKTDPMEYNNQGGGNAAY